MPGAARESAATTAADASTIHPRVRAPRSEETVGLAYALAAYGFWGVVPVFWKQLAHVPAPEVLAHRVAWGFVVFAILLRLRGGVPMLLAALRARRVVAWLALSSALLAINWLTFIHAVATARILETSLGYFLNPSFSVLLGLAVMGERLRPAQWLAVALAAAGVVQLAAEAPEPPWIAVVLAVTFGLYGLVRKTAPVAALPGSTLEAGLGLPVALAYLAVVAHDGGGHFGRADPSTALWLAATGIVTAAPLLWFAGAARRLPLSTIGVLQYLAPSGQLLCAVLLYGEAFTPLHARSFACIWTGVAVFALDGWRDRRGRRVAARAVEARRPPL